VQTVVQAFRPVFVIAVCLFSVPAFAQRGGGGAPQNPRAAAPVDLTGYWLTIVTEDWRYRMVTAARGDHPSVPLNAVGNALANQWDPAKDESAGEQCKAYGAAGVMRLPGRIHITWQDDTTLKIEIEGHTCSIGTAEYNLALGDRRATSVKDYLTGRGVSADRLRTVSYGEERPKYDNSREETRRLNRRAAMVVNLR